MTEFSQTSINQCPICQSTKINFLLSKYDDRFGQPDRFEYYYCAHCNLAFLKNPIVRGDLQKLYTKYYSGLHTTPHKSSRLQQILFKTTLSKLILNKLAGDYDIYSNLKAHEKVLEIGSGFAQSILTKILAKRLQWTALEVNTECVAQIKAAGLPVYYGTMDNIDQLPEKFDVILLSQAIEHQFNINVFFANCRKLLKPGGRIIFTTPNLDSRYRLHYHEQWINWHAPYHTVLLSLKSIEQICQKYNLQIIKFKTFTPTYWHSLQKEFRLPSQGQKNTALSGSYPLIKQFWLSLNLRVFELLHQTDGDCLYCELKKHQ